MRVNSPIGINSKVGSDHRQSAALDHNGPEKAANSVSPIQLKTSTRPPRRRKPRQNDSPQHSHMLNITA